MSRCVSVRVTRVLPWRMISLAAHVAFSQLRGLYPTESAAQRHCLLSNVLWHIRQQREPTARLAFIRKFLGDSFAFADQNVESKEAPKRARAREFDDPSARISPAERSELRATIVRLADSAVAALHARSVQMFTDELSRRLVRAH